MGGLDDDAARSYTKLINQIRSALLGSWPEFEATLRGDILHRQWVLELLAHYGGPTKIQHAGKSRIIAFAKKHKAVKPEGLIDAMFAAIKGQTIRVTGYETIENFGVKTYAKQALNWVFERKKIAAEVESIISEIPQAQLLLSMPGNGPKTVSTILMTCGDFRDFADEQHLASYAGLCPTTRMSGSSINSHPANRGGNKKLKNALWQSAFSSIRHHERSRQYYDRQRRQGKRHNAAVMCLARRRLKVMFAMVKNGEFYREMPPRETTHPMVEPVAA